MSLVFFCKAKLSLICPCPVYAQMYRQDCETFGIVVKMLVAKDPNLEKQLQVPLRENLGEIRERCLEELKLFINQLDSVVRQPETSICDSNTPSTSSLTGHKLSKTTVNHRSSYWHAGLFPISLKLDGLRISWLLAILDLLDILWKLHWRHFDRILIWDRHSCASGLVN